MQSEEHYLKKELYSLIKQDDEIFEFLQNGATDGMFYWDLTAPEQEWMNARFWRELGYEPEEKQHLASEWQDIINQDDLAIALDNFQKHCDDPNYPYDQEVRYTHKNGSTVWIRCRGIVIRDQQQQPVRMLGSHSNITALKQSEARYQRNLKELDNAYAKMKVALEESEMLFDLSPDAYLKLDTKGNILKANAQAEHLFGCEKAVLEQLSLFELIPSTDLDNLKSYFEQGFLHHESSHRQTLKIINKRNKQLVIEVTLNLVATAHGDIVLVNIHDVTEKHSLIQSLQEQLQENKKLQAMALLDPLTQIANKRQFDLTMSEEYNKALRYQQQLSLILLDIDYFKKINDQYGHDIGDQVLVQLAKMVTTIIRSGDTFARIGGEEFALILPFSGLDSAQVMADRICFEVAKRHFVTACGKVINLSVSIGMSVLEHQDNSTSPLFERADQALYQAKRSGRGQVQIIAP